MFAVISLEQSIGLIDCVNINTDVAVFRQSEVYILCMTLP